MPSRRKSGVIRSRTRRVRGVRRARPSAAAAAGVPALADACASIERGRRRQRIAVNPSNAGAQANATRCASIGASPRELSRTTGRPASRLPTA